MPASGQPVDAGANQPAAPPAPLAFTVALQPADAPSPAPLPLAADSAPSPTDDSVRPAETAFHPAIADNGKPATDSGQPHKTPEADDQPDPISPPALNHALTPTVAPPATAAAPASTAAAKAAPTENAAPPKEHIPIAPPPAVAAHDIKLQIAGEGDQRVEVRLTERGGDVFVAVRTPDGRLASDLRQDLPNLAARLEQSGYRATTWQPAAGGERERLTDPKTTASPQDSAGQQDSQNGREQQRDPEDPQQQGQAQPAKPGQSQPGRDFARLLSAIR
jgi:hypothetical protein